MANISILKAFERMWQHVVALVGNKADASHTHSVSDISVDSDIIPTTADTYDLGTSDNPWSALNASSIYTKAINVTDTAYLNNVLVSDGITFGDDADLNVSNITTQNLLLTANNFGFQDYNYTLPTSSGTLATQEWVSANASGGGVGESLEGESVKPTSTTTVTAGTGAEIFNDYRERIFMTNFETGIIEVQQGNVASGRYSHAEGSGTTASGANSHAEGNGTTASASCAHAEGGGTKALSTNSHAEGSGTTASGTDSHAEGYGTTASGRDSHAEGYESRATGYCSHAEGQNTLASGYYSHAEGWECAATGMHSHAAGCGTTANDYQYVVGKYNADTTAPTSDTDTTTAAGLFIVGIGSDVNTRSNGFRVNPAGKVYGTGTFGTSGADYAEYFEWFDGNPNNEDRRGRFVTLEDDKIRCATTNDDYVLGVVSADPSVAGDIHSEDWHNRYLKDVFGSKIVEVVEVEETTNEDGEIIPAHIERRWVLNPDYNPDLKYVSREERPEWAAIGIIGKLVVVDDGTCQVNGYCHPNVDGTATASQEKTNYRVMERLDDTHIRIFIK